MSRTTLIECQPRRADGTVETLRLVDRSPRAAAYLGAQWLPLVTELPAFEMAIGFDGQRFGASPSPQIGALAFALAPEIRSCAGWVWRDAPVTIRQAEWPLGGGNPADGAFNVAWTGNASAFSSGDGVARVELIDKGQLLRVPVAPLRFGSSGIALLDAAAAARDRQAGQVVPVAFGPVFTLPGLLVDRANNIWLFAGQPASSVQAFYDGGAAFTLGAARASLAALQGTAPASGTVDWCLNAGGLLLARPADRPVYPFTCDATFGSAGLGDLASAIVGGRLPFRAGVITALNGLGLGDCGLYIDEEASVADALDRLLGGLGIFWKVRADGTIDAKRIGWGTPVASFASHQRHAPRRLQTILPTARRQLGFARNNRVHGEAEIARILTEGQDGFTPTLAPQTVSISTDADGVGGDYTNAGGVMKVLRGTTALAPVFSVVETIPASPAWISIDPVTGVYIVTDPEVDQASAVLRAAVTGVPEPFDLVYTLSKSRAGVGVDGTVPILSNESHTVATDSAGGGGSYATAGGVMTLLRGAEPVAASFSIAGRIPASPSGWITINATTGVYTVSDPGVNQAVAIVRASFEGRDYDRNYTLAKSRAGAAGAPGAPGAPGPAGPVLVLTADSQGFIFQDNAASPGSQAITLTATLSGITGTITWTTSPSVTLSGTGNTRTLTIANFGSNRQVTVTATLGELSDRITIVRLDRSSAAANADVTRMVLPGLSRGEWASGVSYAVGDFVNRNNITYVCKVAHTSSGSNGPPGANWEPLTAGPDTSFASDAISSAVTNASFGTTPIAELTIRTKSAGSVALNGNMQVQASVTNVDPVQAQCKWQRFDGSSWIDVGTASTSSAVNPGDTLSVPAFNVNATATSLAAATSYNFRLLARVIRTAGSDDLFLSGLSSGSGT